MTNGVVSDSVANTDAGGSSLACLTLNNEAPASNHLIRKRIFYKSAQLCFLFARIVL